MRCTNSQRGLEQKGANRALVYSSGWMDMSVAIHISSLHNLLYIQAGNMKHLLCQYPEPASSETAYLAESFSGNCWTPWSTALFEKLTVPQPLKKFFTFYRTQSFITVFKTTCRLYLASAWQTQSTNCHPVPLRYLLILSLTLPWSSRWTPSFHISMPKPCTHTPSTQDKLHAPFISLPRIWPP